MAKPIGTIGGTFSHTFSNLGALYAGPNSNPHPGGFGNGTFSYN